MFSRPSALQKIDRRTVESQLLARTQAELIAHLGGEAVVTVPQRLLVQATSLLVLRLRCALDRYLRGGAEDIETLDRYICVLQNSLRQNLLALGLERPKEQVPSLAQYIEGKARRVA
jgi:hypothetical protein